MNSNWTHFIYPHFAHLIVFPSHKNSIQSQKFSNNFLEDKKKPSPIGSQKPIIYLTANRKTAPERSRTRPHSGNHRKPQNTSTISYKKGPRPHLGTSRAKKWSPQLIPRHFVLTVGRERARRMLVPDAH